MVRNYTIVTPLEESGAFNDLWNSCLLQLKGIKDKGDRIFKVVIFVDAPNEESLIQFRKKISDQIGQLFTNRPPAYGVFAGKPELPFKVSLEVGFISEGENVSITYRRNNWGSYTVIEDDYHRELWACGLGALPSTGSVEADAERAFDHMVQLLAEEQMSINHVVRQWNYIGEILRIKYINNKPVQNYQVFNEVRNQFYGNHFKASLFPSATGIGTLYRGVSIDFCAVEAKKDTINVAVDNEKQENPYTYGQEVLIGESSTGDHKKQPPQFERARFLSFPGSSTLFLSGTASIIGQKTVGVEDIEKQTNITIEHLKTLGDFKNVNKYVAGAPNASGYFSSIRVYIKRENDFDKVKDICNEAFENVPVVYVNADICRDNLLVEIEGETVY